MSFGTVLASSVIFHSSFSDPLKQSSLFDCCCCCCCFFYVPNTELLTGKSRESSIFLVFNLSTDGVIRLRLDILLFDVGLVRAGERSI